MKAILIAAILAATACRASVPQPPPVDEVIVMGMIHSGHVDSELYGPAVIRELVRRIDPDFILVEIPPDRLPTAMEQLRSTGEITEARVSRFPEYVDAILPMAAGQGFRVIPCAAWTAEMARSRAQLLAEWKSTRPAESAEVDSAEQRAEALQAAGGDDPRWIHDPRYDALTKDGLEPYDRLFNEDLGAGGWTHINRAHFALIEDAIETHGGGGRRFLVTFGAWHKYWFIEQLQGREGVRLLDLRDFLDPDYRPGQVDD